MRKRKPRKFKYVTQENVGSRNQTHAFLTNSLCPESLPKKPCIVFVVYSSFLKCFSSKNMSHQPQNHQRKVSIYPTGNRAKVLQLSQASRISQHGGLQRQ